MMVHNATNVRGLDTMLWCVPLEEKNLLFICEKELTVMEDTVGGEADEDTAEEEEHLDAS